jgi:MFS family permease
MSAELGLVGNEYNTALVIFFVPYILFEIPSNVLLKKFKPHVWLSGCMFLFGITTTLQGIVTNYSGLLATRFVLGLCESGIFPGCFYLLGSWYLRTEAQRRFSFFFCSTTLAGAFAGLLAAAIGKMDGVAGYKGWRWIFILEGLLTCVVSFAFFFILPDFPEDVKWLGEDERAFITSRLAAEQGASAVERKTSAKDVVNVFKDFKIWVGGMMYLGLVVSKASRAPFCFSVLTFY